MRNGAWRTAKLDSKMRCQFLSMVPKNRFEPGFLQIKQNEQDIFLSCSFS